MEKETKLSQNSPDVHTRPKSKFDSEFVKIKGLLALGLSVRKIAIFLGYTNHIGLNTYINKRNLRETANTNGTEQDRGVEKPTFIESFNKMELIREHKK